MSEYDRYVHAIQDLLAQIPTPAEQLKAIEQAVGRFSGPAETRQAANDLVGGLAAMPARMMELHQVLSDFGTPAQQLRELEEQLATTRQQLELAAKQLKAAEKTVGRVAALAEQLSQLQRPFARATDAWRKKPAE